MIRLSLPLLSLVLLLSACAGFLFPPEQSFPAFQRDFSERLRWGDFPGASRHFAPELVQDFLDEFQAPSGIHFTEVRAETTEYRPEAGRMLTWMTVEYYRLPSAVLQKHRFLLEWEYVSAGTFKKGTWRLITPFPELPSPVRDEQN